jgi:hypothetical protein
MFKSSAYPSFCKSGFKGTIAILIYIKLFTHSLTSHLFDFQPTFITQSGETECLQIKSNWWPMSQATYCLPSINKEFHA